MSKALVPVRAHPPLRQGETYYVRVSQTLQYENILDLEKRGICVIGHRAILTGLRLGFLHRAHCHHAKHGYGADDHSALIPVQASPLAEALPRCRKCFPPARSTAEYMGREIGASAESGKKGLAGRKPAGCVPAGCETSA